MTITDKQRRWLKAQSHDLKPIVLVGQAGATAPVLAEIAGALDHHELLKVKIAAGGDRDWRDEQIAVMVRETRAELVNRIGNVAVLYRANPKKRTPIALPAQSSTPGSVAVRSIRGQDYPATKPKPHRSRDASKRRT